MYQYAPDSEEIEDDIMQGLLYDLINGGSSPESESINSLNEEIYGKDNDID